MRNEHAGTLNGFEAMLLDFVGMGEAPVYPTYDRLSKEIGAPISMKAFLETIDGLVRTDTVRLWAVDPAGHERDRHFSVPSELKDAYATAMPSDKRYDPFAYSLTPGDNFPERIQPAWEVDLDFARSTFRLRASSTETGAFETISRFFPGLKLEEERRTELSDGTQQMEGSIRRT